MTQPRKPQGEPLDMDMQAMDTAAVITAVDVAFATVVWRQHAPGKLHDLLDAVPLKEEED